MKLIKLKIFSKISTAPIVLQNQTRISEVLHGVSLMIIFVVLQRQRRGGPESRATSFEGQVSSFVFICFIHHHVISIVASQCKVNFKSQVFQSLLPTHHFLTKKVKSISRKFFDC